MVLVVSAKGFTMNIKGKKWVEVITLTVLLGLDKKSRIKLLFPFMCLTEKSYLENQSLSLKIWGFGGILFLNSKIFGNGELSLCTWNWCLLARMESRNLIFIWDVSASKNGIKKKWNQEIWFSSERTSVIPNGIKKIWF